MVAPAYFLMSPAEYNTPHGPAVHPTLLQMVGQENLKHVRNLAEDTFDPVLWKTLNRTGPANYHWIIQKELKSGCLWAQTGIDPEVAIHWSTQSGWIHRAYLTKEETVIVESFIAHAINLRATEQRMSIEKFQKLVGDYLTETSSQAPVEANSLSLTSLQKQLELAPIICKITRSACKKLAELRNEYSNSTLDTSLLIGADDSQGAIFSPLTSEGIQLIAISKYFLNGRLPLLHEQEGKPEETSEPVAPVIRSWQALSDLQALRKMRFGKNQDPFETLHLDPERAVSDLSSLNIKTYENLKAKTLKDLRAWLVLVPGGLNTEPYEFEKLHPEKSQTKDRLELSIDFKDTWRLKSRFFEKV